MSQPGAGYDNPRGRMMVRTRRSRGRRVIWGLPGPKSLLGARGRGCEIYSGFVLTKDKTVLIYRAPLRRDLARFGSNGS